MMSRILALFMSMMLFCCSKKKQSEFVFDNSKISEIENHIYTYDSLGRIILDRQISNRILNGVRLDTAFSSKSYTYFKKTKLKSLVEQNGYDTDSTVYFYNDVDSLISKYTIRNKKDTVKLWEFRFRSEER